MLLACGSVTVVQRSTAESATIRLTPSGPLWSLELRQPAWYEPLGGVEPAGVAGGEMEAVKSGELPVEPWVPAEVPMQPDVPFRELPTAGGFGALSIDQVAGEGILVGEVSDSTSLDPIAGAIVDVIGSGRTAETDEKGRFRIDGLPEGDFLVEASALSYAPMSLGVTVSGKAPVELRFSMRAKPVEGSGDEYLLEEESVVGEFQESSEGDLFLDLETTTQLSSGLSKEEFTKTGVSDAAGAVGKISGANIVGGKFAVVRGLADRYVTTLFNGAAISSADPSRKAVQLDIFPTVALQGIDISKTYDPGLPGDFGGGTVRITSLAIPRERIAEFKYKMSWNSNLGDRMLVHPDRELGFLGDVDRPIPDSFMWNLDENGDPLSFNSGGSRVVPNNNNRNAIQQQAQVQEGLKQEQLAQQAVDGVRALHDSQSFMPKEVKPEEAHSMSLVYGDRVELENGGEFGFMSAFQRGSKDEVQGLGPEYRETSPARSWMEESYSREVDWSLYLAAGYKPNENHEFQATYFRKHIATDEITHGTDFEIAGSDVYGAFAKNDAVIDRYGASAVYKKEFWTIDPIIRDTEILQFGGKHRNDAGTSLKWGLTRSTARESRPHTSTFQNGILDFTDPRIAEEAAQNPNFVYNPSLGKISTIEYQTFVNDGNGSQDSSRETQFIEEESFEPSLDLTQAFYFSDDEEDGPRLEISAGGSHLTKDRDQQGRVYLLKTASWERWIQRNPPAWWPSSSITPFSPGSPLASNKFPDGTPLPEGYGSFGEYLAKNPDKLTEFFNGYGSENIGRIPGTGTATTSGNYVAPDAPYYVNGSGLEVRNVASDLSLTSLYASSTYFAKNWRAGIGARWEEETKSYEVAADPLTRLLTGDPSRFGSVTTTAFIPSLVAGLDLDPEKTWMNFAWSRTVARPTFHEFLPIESISQDTGIIRRGNPDLTETSIDNLDVSLDHVFSDRFNVRTSLFRKNLADPIVVVQRVDLGQNSNTYVNGDSGEITGFELEGTWKGEGPFSLTGNYTFIDSLLKYRVNQGIEVTELETRFPYQPSQIFNLTLGWEPEKMPWKAYLTANFTDEYPTVLRSEPNGYDVWLKPQVTMDLTVARLFEFDAFDGIVTLGVKNLLNDDRLYEYRGGPPGGQSDGRVYSQESPGRTYSIEFKAEF